MAFKVVALFSALAVASAQLLDPALRSAYGLRAAPLAYSSGYGAVASFPASQLYANSYAASPLLSGSYANAPLYARSLTAAPRVAVAAAPVAVARTVAAAPVAAVAAREDAEYDPNPSYDFAYSVDDPSTGDSKSASESRQGDVVQGSYSLNEADGSRRIVDYTADPVNGFNAVVHKEAGAIASRATPIAVAAAPVLAARAAPVAVARVAPVAVARAAPLAVAAAPFGAVASPLAYSARALPLAARTVLRASAAVPASITSTFSSPYATYAY